MNTLVSEKVLADAKTVIKRELKNWGGGVCWGALLDLNGEKLKTPVYSACHAWVSHAFKAECGGRAEAYGYNWGDKYDAKAKNFLVLTCHKKGSASQEASDFLVKWLARESPFSEFVLNRDDDDSLVNGGMILYCGPGGLNLAQALWICKVGRFTTEGNKAANVFYELVKGGVDGMMAVYVASYIRGEGNTGKGYTFTGLDGHSTVINNTFGSGTSTADLIGMMNRKLNFKPLSTATVFERMSVKGVEKVLGDPVTKIKGFVKPVQKDDGWGGKIYSNEVDAEELVARVKKWENDIQVLVRGEDIPPPMPDSNTVYLDVDL